MLAPVLLNCTQILDNFAGFVLPVDKSWLMPKLSTGLFLDDLTQNRCRRWGSKRDSAAVL